MSPNFCNPDKITRLTVGYCYIAQSSLEYHRKLELCNIFVSQPWAFAVPSVSPPCDRTKPEWNKHANHNSPTHVLTLPWVRFRVWVGVLPRVGWVGTWLFKCLTGSEIGLFFLIASWPPVNNSLAPPKRGGRQKLKRDCRTFSVHLGLPDINHFTPKSDQVQISPVASPVILHHTVWRTWLFIAYSDARWLYYQLSLPHLYISL